MDIARFGQFLYIAGLAVALHPQQITAEGFPYAFYDSQENSNTSEYPRPSEITNFPPPSEESQYRHGHEPRHSYISARTISASGSYASTRLRDNCGSLMKNCTEQEFRCLSGGCISYLDVCDGMPHCEDSSDESIAICAGVGYIGWCPLPPYKPDRTQTLRGCENNSSGAICQAKPGELVYPGSLLRVQCKNTENEEFSSVCLDGSWSPPIEACSPADCGVLSEDVKDYDTDLPWQVKIYEKNSVVPMCAGVIISRYAIISAAHCFINMSTSIPRPRLPREVYITVGKKQHARIFQVSAMHFPPDGFFKIENKNDQYNGDLVILELKKRIPYQPDIIPICVWTFAYQKNHNNDPTIVSTYTPPLKVRYPGDGLITNKEFKLIDCSQFAEAGWTDAVTADKVCIVDPVGDNFYMEPEYNGGTGLYMRRNRTSKNYRLRGIFSATFYDARRVRSALFFTDVKEYSFWIHKVLEEITRKRKSALCMLGHECVFETLFSDYS